MLQCTFATKTLVLQIAALTWSNAGVLASAADKDVRTWTLDPTGALRDSQTFRSHVGLVDALAWNPADNTTVASAASDKNVILWDTRSGKQASAISIPKSSPLCCSWVHDGTALGVTTRDDTLYFFDARKAAVMGSYAFTQEANEFAFSPSGLIFAGTGLRGAVVDEGNVTILQWARTGAVSQGGGGQGQSSAVPPVLPSVQPSASQQQAPDGPGVPSSASSTGGVTVSEVTRLRGHAAAITTLRPNLAWTRLATGSSDGLVCLWDTADMTCIGCLDRADGQVRSISWSGSGSHLAASHGDTNDLQKYLDICRADGTLIKRVTSPVSINHVAWCPTAPLIAYSLDDTAGLAVAAAIVSAAAEPSGQGGRYGGYNNRAPAAAMPNIKDFSVKILAA